MTRTRALLIALSALVTLVTLGVVLRSDYGVTWDFPQSAFYGERYVRYFATWDARYLDFGTRQIEYPPSHPDLEPGPDGKPSDARISGPHFIWPLPFTLGAAGCALFHLGLPLLDFHAAHHLVDFVLAAALATAMVLVAARRVGLLAGAAAALLLALHPAWFGHLFNNLRDIPVACFFGLALLMVPAFVERGSRAALLGYTLCLGAGLACKTPAAFVPPIALAYAAFAAPPGRRVRRLVALALASGAGVFVFVGLWPWLWADVPFRLQQHFAFLRQELNLSSRFQAEPLLSAVFTMPPVMLALGLFGIVALGRDRAHRGLFVLLLVWLLVPLARIAMPRARSYGGIRHFIEFLPAFALFAGVGVARCRDALRRVDLRLAPMTALLAVPMIVPVVRTHPYQTSYHSFLCGGVAGARTLGLTAAYDFWGNSMRQGIDWLSRNAPAESSVIVPLGEQIPSLVAGIWLRADVAVIDAAHLDALDPMRAGHVYTMTLVRAPDDPQDRLPWLTAARAGREVMCWDLESEPLLDLRDLGAHGAAKAEVQRLRAAHRERTLADLPHLKEVALAHLDVESLQGYFRALVDVHGLKAALERFAELLPRIEDPVMREKLWRTLHELREAKGSDR